MRRPLHAGISAEFLLFAVANYLSLGYDLLLITDPCNGIPEKGFKPSGISQPKRKNDFAVNNPERIWTSD